MEKETTPTPNVHPGAKYRGAVVEVSSTSTFATLCVTLTTGSSTPTGLLLAGRRYTKSRSGSGIRERIRSAPVSTMAGLRQREER